MAEQESAGLKRLLLVAHAPSANTRVMCDAVARGVADYGSGTIQLVVKPPLEAAAEDVLAAQAIILGTPENLGYMCGALKDFFDRIYYPCLERTQGLPYALYIRAGQSVGMGSRRAVEGIVTGLRWRAVQEPVICHGPYSEVMAAGLDLGIY